MSEPALRSVRIVLVEPAGPLNVGSIARIMKNMGLSQLILVKPGCDPLSEEARRMAVHAGDVLEAAKIVETLPEALRGCHRAIATTVRARTHETELEHPRNALPWLVETGIESALIFGSEDRGLSNEELKYAQRFVCIPSSPVYPSLNLAQAVAICCYELYQWLQPDKIEQGISIEPAMSAAGNSAETAFASIDALEGYYEQLETLLLKIGYLYPHTAASRMEKLRRLLNRAYPSESEVAMLRGMLRQIGWALKAKD